MRLKFLAKVSAVGLFLVLGACADDTLEPGPADLPGDSQPFPANPEPPASNDLPSDPVDEPPVNDPVDPTPNPPNTPGAACIEGAVSDYESCCDEAPARCVPKSNVAEIFHERFSPCGDDSICMPESMFERNGTFTNDSCNSVTGAGGCISRCSLHAAPYLSLLEQDTCPDGRVCAPCLSPLDGTPTSACEPFSCGDAEPRLPDDPEPEPVDPEPEPNAFSCENPPTEDVVDASGFPACCDGAHCVPKEMIPGELADVLDVCPDGKSVCVPDPFITSMGFFVPDSCELPGGIEGRCLSTCLPNVAEQMDLLPQATCKPNERCSPCCDPTTGVSTGACDVGCDVGFAGGECGLPEYEACCGGEGHCIPEALIPADKLKSLDKKGCGKGTRCVPDLLQDPNYQPPTCSTSIPFLDVSYDGVCLPKCLKVPLGFAMGKGNCGAGDQCVPCNDPWVGLPLGAPGCN